MFYDNGEQSLGVGKYLILQATGEDSGYHVADNVGMVKRKYKCVYFGR